MIKPLRKRHLQFWVYIALILPAAFYSAYLNIPDPVVEETAVVSTDLLPLEISELEHVEGLTVILRGQGESRQLEFRLSETWPSASAVVYLDGGESRILLGRLSTRGSHGFLLPSRQAVYDIIIRDEIKGKDILNLTIEE